MPMWEIDKIRSMSEGSQSKYSAWNTWRDEMIKKSVIKRHFKMLISGNPSEALATAMQIEQENNALMTFKKQQQGLMSGFDDVETNEPQKEIPIMEAEEINSNLPLTDEEMELELQKEADKNQTNMFPTDDLTTE